MEDDATYNRDTNNHLRRQRLGCNRTLISSLRRIIQRPNCICSLMQTMIRYKLLAEKTKIWNHGPMCELQYPCVSHLQIKRVSTSHESWELSMILHLGIEKKSSSTPVQRCCYGGWSNYQMPYAGREKGRFCGLSRMHHFPPLTCYTAWPNGDWSRQIHLVSYKSTPISYYWLLTSLYLCWEGLLRQGVVINPAGA
jgi:hypothetical protein